jgi:nitric oxide reductase subunit B
MPAKSLAGPTGFEWAVSLPALEPLAFLGMLLYAFIAACRSALGQPNGPVLHGSMGATAFSAIGGRRLGRALPRTPGEAVAERTSRREMHGHRVLVGAHAPIDLTGVSVALPTPPGRRDEKPQSALGLAGR